MKRNGRTPLALVAAVAATVAGSTGVQPLLEARFDAHPLDRPIGTGGPALGEPISVAPSITAIVRGAPLPTPALELTDASAGGAGAAEFGFLGAVEVEQGELSIAMDLWFEQLQRYAVLVREAGGAARNFVSITFIADGSVLVDDAGGVSGFLPGSYGPGRRIPLLLVFDLDAATYDLYLDGALRVADEPHDVPDRGVGTVHVGLDFDVDLDGRLFLDDLVVVPFSLVVLQDGFESGDASAWSGVVP